MTKYYVQDILSLGLVCGPYDHYYQALDAITPHLMRPQRVVYGNESLLDE